MKKEIILRSADFADGKNATPAVVAALRELSLSEGTRLAFEKGTYHFYEDGAVKRTYAVSNNSYGEKSVVFHMDGIKALTVDGGGAELVFHGRAFPFIADGCRELTLCNMTLDRALPPVAELRFRDVCDEGFFIEIDKQKTPYTVENGDVVFHREGWELSSRERMLALHKIEPFAVQYLFTKNCTDMRENLPAPLMDAVAEEEEGGIRFRYSPSTPTKCRFSEGELALSNLEGGRDIDVFFLVGCENTVVKNVTVRRGVGMGIIAQVCHDLYIDGFKTASEYYNAAFSLTADALHLVNCDGRLDIRGCAISNTMDDAINIHGIYTELQSAERDRLFVRLMHHEQKGVNIYRPRDILHLIDPASMDIVAKFEVSGAELDDRDKFSICIEGRFISGEDAVKNGFFVENPNRMPDVNVCGNRFCHLPHLRISGAGEILIENNDMDECAAGLLAMDLAQYWYESGRIKCLTFRKNRVKSCHKLGGRACVYISVSGFNHGEVPKIHDRIEIVENEFVDVRDFAVSADGVKNLILRDNKIIDAANPEHCIRIDGISR